MAALISITTQATWKEMAELLYLRFIRHLVHECNNKIAQFEENMHLSCRISMHDFSPLMMMDGMWPGVERFLFFFYYFILVYISLTFNYFIYLLTRLLGSYIVIHSHVSMSRDMVGPLCPRYYWTFIWTLNLHPLANPVFQEVIILLRCSQISYLEFKTDWLTD